MKTPMTLLQDNQQYFEVLAHYRHLFVVAQQIELYLCL